MRVKVEVLTQFSYVAVVDATSEELAVKEAMLDALIAETSDLAGQTANWEIVDRQTPIVPDKAKVARIQSIKHRIGERLEIARILEDDGA